MEMTGMTQGTRGRNQEYSIIRWYLNCLWNGVRLLENRLGFVVNVYCKLKGQHLKVKKINKIIIDMQRKRKLNDV